MNWNIEIRQTHKDKNNSIEFQYWHTFGDKSKIISTKFDNWHPFNQFQVQSHSYFMFDNWICEMTFETIFTADL